MRRLLLGLFVIALLVLFTDSAPAQAQPATGIIRADSQGDIVLSQPAYLGKTLLPAGSYRVHSHGSGEKQEIHFEREMTLSVVHPESSSVIVYDEAGRVDCSTEKLPKKSGQTTVHYVMDKGVMRLVSVEIEGESDMHGL